MGLAWSSSTPEEVENVSSETEQDKNETIAEATTNNESESQEEKEETDKERRKRIEEETDEERRKRIEEETDEERRKRIEEDMIKFKEDLSSKREQAKKKLGEVSDEIKGLRDLLEQEIAKRKELEEQLLKYKSGNLGFVKEKVDGSKLSAEVESLRISKYEEDDDEIDIIDDDEDKSQQEDSSDNTKTRKRKGVKKKVSFSVDLVKEEKFDPNEPQVELAKEATQEETQSEDKSTKESSEEQNEEVDLVKDLTDKNKKLENQVKALKDVNNLSKQLLELRESQVDELNNKLSQVEEKEKDYEKKMNAMKELRKLYDERGRALLMEHKHQLEKEKTRVTVLESKLRFAEGTIEDQQDKSKYLEEKVKNLDNQLDTVRAELSETKIKLATEKESLFHASSQISLINNLVSQVISGPELDLDHLARFLEDNHSLINELTAKGEIDYVASALVGVAGGIVEIPKEEKSDIAENLGKVWRVLVELLSHHKKSDSTNPQEWESCYKSVDTPKGPKLVISVSQTFIKLKDLILEKNSLVKEVGRLEKLNEHLEHRMEEQGSRLSLVTEELHNTWDVVNKLKKQHDSLHTHERILKHELQHKRSMLNGLKKQLEVCREQWALAREKNSKTENDWMLLRAEFASRKQKKKFFNSAESGYEDEETQSPEYDTDDDKSIEIEEESPENSVGEHVNPVGSLSPSEISTESNSALDECNGPISEILDGILDDAYKIAKTSKNIPTTDQKTDSSLEEKTQIEEPILIEESTSFSIAAVSEIDLFDAQAPSERITYATYCDYPITRLEQIPEVEEEVSNEGSYKEADEIKDKLEIISVTNLKNDTEVKQPTQEEPSKNNDNPEVSEEAPVSLTQVIGSTSDQTNVKSETGSLTTDEILKRREERLKRMEESCKSLFIQMGQTSNRGADLSNKLDQIHTLYGPQEPAENTTAIPDERGSSNNTTQSSPNPTDTERN